MLMAIEDFLRASHYELDLLELPGIHGLGILTPTSLKRQNPDLAQLLGKLDFSPTVVRYVQELERARLEERREHGQRLAEESRKLREERQRLNEMRHELSHAGQDVLQLTRWMETLDSGVSALLRSRQWKVGRTAGELYRRATLNGEGAALDEYLEGILRKFRTWRMSGTEQDQDRKGTAGE